MSWDSFWGGAANGAANGGGGGGGGSFWSGMGSAAIMTGGSLLANMLKKDPQLPYGQTQEGFMANLENEKAIAAAHDATALATRGGGGGGGDGGISARIARDSAMRQMIMKAYSDNLANALQGRQWVGQQASDAAKAREQALLAQGQLAQGGFDSTAQILARGIR